MATRTSLVDTLSLGDPAFAHNFDLYFPTIPGLADTRHLTFACQSTSLPGFGVEVGEVLLHGVKIPYAGAATFTQSLQVTMVMSADWKIRDAFRAWKDRMRNWRTNTGLLSAEYCIDPQIVLWDDRPNVVRTIQIYRAFIETFDDVQLDGSSGANVITASITLRYTDHEDI